MKKYELIRDEDSSLYRIRALKKIKLNTGSRKDVEPGDIGGLVQSENNLSQEGSCWIFDNAKVTDDAQVLDDAIISEWAEVSDNAVVKDNSFVSEYAQIRENAVIQDNAVIKDSAFISGTSVVSDFAEIKDSAIVAGNSSVFGHAVISDNAIVNNDAQVYGSACVNDFSKILNKAIVHGSTQISGSSIISDSAVIGGFAQLENVIVEDESSISAYAHIKTKKDKPIVVSGKSNINFFAPPAFEGEVGAFEIRDALINKPSDLFIIPINYGNRDIFLVKYYSRCGKMFYNSLTDEISTDKEFKEESIEAFERYASQSPEKCELIKPFIDWLKDNISSGVTKFVPTINNLARRFEFCFPSVSIDKKTFPVFFVYAYLEAHLFMIPFLLGCDSTCLEFKKKLEQIAISIIEEGCLDICTRRLVSIDNIVFINRPLMNELLNFYSISEASGMEFSEITSMKDVVNLSVMKKYSLPC